MVSERRRELLLGALVIVLAVVGYRVWPRTAATPPQASNVRGAARSSTGHGDVSAPDVHLEELEADRPKPGETERNLFRFKPIAPPPAPTPPPLNVAPPPPPPGPPSTPPLPPITLKFIGILEANGQKLAALSDGRGVYHGTEGQTILGQYRIVRIGVESIELAYVDGRGRQTIRLSGS